MMAACCFLRGRGWLCKRGYLEDFPFMHWGYFVCKGLLLPTPALELSAPLSAFCQLVLHKDSRPMENGWYIGWGTASTCSPDVELTDVFYSIFATPYCSNGPTAVMDLQTANRIGSSILEGPAHPSGQLKLLHQAADWRGVPNSVNFLSLPFLLPIQWSWKRRGFCQLLRVSPD